MVKWCPNENEVIELVIDKLEQMGFTINSKCNTKQQGIDVIACKGNTKLLIEAKGGTSSKPGTSNSGNPFTRSQVHTHVSVAVHSIMKYITANKTNTDVLVGIALPLEKNHIDLINMIKYGLERLGVIIFWVKEDCVIIEELGVKLK